MNHLSKRRRRGFLLALVSLVLVSLLIAQDQFPAILNSETIQVPFTDGEELTYEVNWKPIFFFPAFKAGEIRLSVAEVEDENRDLFRIEGWAVSEGMLARVAGFEIHNYFRSDIDRYSLKSYRILQQFRQGSRHRDLELIFDYESNRTFIKETDPSVNPPRVIRDSRPYGIPGPASDVLSVFYVARLRDFRPGEGFLLHLNERGTFSKVRVTAEEFENVETVVGDFPAVKLATEGSFFRGGGAFRIWYSRNGLRLPVRFEAEVKFGKVYGKLIRFNSANYSRATIKTRN